MQHDIQIIKNISTKISFERIPLFRETIGHLKEIQFGEDDIVFLAELYFLLKDISCRSLILQALVLKDNGRLHDFFYNAFMKERYLDMKLAAIRGYSNYATEQEVEILMSKFNKLLIKRQATTPNNYEEYEYLRSVFGLPYLIDRYKYKCFVDAFEQVKKQYNAMPDAFKGYFTFNEKGDHIALMNPEEIKKRMDDFFNYESRNQ